MPKVPKKQGHSSSPPPASTPPASTPVPTPFSSPVPTVSLNPPGPITVPYPEQDIQDPDILSDGGASAPDPNSDPDPYWLSSRFCQQQLTAIQLTQQNEDLSETIKQLPEFLRITAETCNLKGDALLAKLGSVANAYEVPLSELPPRVRGHAAEQQLLEAAGLPKNDKPFAGQKPRSICVPDAVTRTAIIEIKHCKYFGSKSHIRQMQNHAAAAQQNGKQLIYILPHGAKIDHLKFQHIQPRPTLLFSDFSQEQATEIRDLLFSTQSRTQYASDLMQNLMRNLHSTLGLTPPLEPILPRDLAEQFKLRIQSSEEITEQCKPMQTKVKEENKTSASSTASDEITSQKSRRKYKSQHHSDTYTGKFKVHRPIIDKKTILGLEAPIPIVPAVPKPDAVDPVQEAEKLFFQKQKNQEAAKKRQEKRQRQTQAKQAAAEKLFQPAPSPTSSQKTDPSQTLSLDLSKLNEEKIGDIQETLSLLNIQTQSTPTTPPDTKSAQTILENPTPEEHTQSILRYQRRQHQAFAQISDPSILEALLDKWKGLQGYTLTNIQQKSLKITELQKKIEALQSDRRKPLSWKNSKDLLASQKKLCELTQQRQRHIIIVTGITFFLVTWFLFRRPSEMTEHKKFSPDDIDLSVATILGVEEFFPPQIQYQLARYFSYEDTGLPKAIHLHTLASAAGYPPSMLHLGHLLISAPEAYQNKALGRDYLTRALEAGESGAAELLAQLDVQADKTASET